jgi:hypothetical protein
MKTKDFFGNNNRTNHLFGGASNGLVRSSRVNGFMFLHVLLLITMSFLFSQCKEEELVLEETETGTTGQTQTTTEPTSADQYNLEQAVSDEAQRNTIAFDGLGFMTGNFGSQTFLPPGKVADYSGFQYLRDNDPTKLGHNTSFVTIIAFNILNILTTDQINMFVVRAKEQIDQINQFGYKRFPLCKAFRRLIEGDLPSGTTGLNKDVVMSYTADLYRIDGLISYNRAQLFGQVLNSLSTAQKAKLVALKNLKGIGNWDAKVTNPLEALRLQQDINVAVMTYASEMYAWYAGTVKSDVYFCPERHGTYFGSFYLKDWPAMGNPNYTIDEKMTADAGTNLLAILTTTQADQIRGIVDLQRASLTELVLRRTDISTELRKFLSSQTADSTSVIALSKGYGELDGQLSYFYATNFSQVYKSLTTDQKAKVLALANTLGYINPTGAFLYSQPIAMPTVINTDFMFK